MKPNPPSIGQTNGPAPQPDEGVRKPVLVGAGVVLVLCVGGMLLFAMRGKKEAPGPVDPAVSGQAQTQVRPRPAPARVDDEPKVVETTGSTNQAQFQPPPIPVAVPAAKRTVAPEVAAAPKVEPSPMTRQLVNALTQLDLKQGPMTPEKAGEWKQNLQQLASQGAAAVPAIREFLDKNLDLNFDATSGGLVGQSSLRLAFLDSLQNIGGPEALALSSQVLQTTLDPREIALLAQNLEKQAPGQYGAMASEAARSALAMASSGQLEGRDVGPLFNVLQQFGGPEAVAELEKFSNQYRYYATISLANLPDKAGIPALIQMVEDPNAVSKGGRTPALQMLAQAALDSPEALKTLLDQARLNQIPSATWLNIASILSGDKVLIGTAPIESGVRSFHLSSGNQNFYTIPDRSPWTADQVQKYDTIVGKLLEGNQNELAKTALQNARAALQGHLAPPPQ